MHSNQKTNYQSTVYACYIANIVQAVVINLTPLLFLVLKDSFGLTYSQFGTLVLVNFCTQVAVDIGFSKAVERHGFRIFVVAAHILCVVGFILFACTPVLLQGFEFLGFLLSTMLFAGSGGLLELLLSPIIDALPSENSAKAMSLLHSMYAWGQLGCIILTTLAVFLGVPWYFIMAAWAVLPLINTFVFLKVPLRHKVDADQAMHTEKMVASPLFFLAFGAILFGGAAEVTIAQWTSTFMQNGMGIPKVWGDLLGMGGFALMLGIGRLLHGLYGERFDLSKLLVFGSFAAIGSYLLVALSPSQTVGIIACIVTGFFVSLLWPGTLTIASACLPTAGASMFALLAAGGDIGGSIGPWLTGVLTDGRITAGASDAQGLRFGVLCAVVFPLMALVFQLLLRRQTKKAQKTDSNIVNA